MTIKDIARETGLSVATVSRIINGSRGVRPENAERIKAYLAQHEYTPNLAARQLVTGKKPQPSVVVTFPMELTSFFMAVLRGVRKVLNEHSYNLILLDTEQGDSVLWARLAADSLTGILSISRPLNPTEKQIFKDHHLPVVLVDGYDAEVHSFHLDNVEGGRLAAEYLHQSGCNYPIYIGNPLAEGGPGRERGDGFGGHFRYVNRPWAYLWEELEDSSSRSFMQKGYELTQKAVGRWPHADGFFYFCDEMALGGQKALREAQHKAVIVGYDGWDVGEFAPFSTIAQPAEDLGREAATYLLSLIGEGNRSAVHRKFIPQLVTRTLPGF